MNSSFQPSIRKTAQSESRGGAKWIYVNSVFHAVSEGTLKNVNNPLQPKCPSPTFKSKYESQFQTFR